MERNTKTLTLGDDPKISEMPKSEDEQRRQNEDYTEPNVLCQINGLLMA